MTSVVLDMKTGVEHPETGIDDKKKLAANLSGCLADTYLLMTKTLGYHWNVVGPMFHSVHLLTEEHYEDLFAAADDLAERIRALGYPAPTSVTQMISLSEIAEDMGNPTTEQMIDTLIADHETAAKRFRVCVQRADKADDMVTADLLTARLAFHEKAIWMLRATLSG